MNKFHLVGAFFACLFSFYSTVASAALVDQGMTTWDTDSGLAWLDLSESNSYSYNDISTQFGVGGDFEGYRYALENEVITFFGNAGITGFLTGYTTINYQPILDLATLLGLPFSLTDTTFQTQSIHGTIDQVAGGPGGAPPSHRSIVLSVNITAGTGATGMGGFPDSSVDDIRGHWLIAPVMEPVPVPAAFWLFCSGLLGLISIARRKKAA